MIGQVQAYKASDGKLFENSFAAVEHDTRVRLEQCIGQVCTTEIMHKALAIHAILGPLVEELLRRQVSVATEEPR